METSIVSAVCIARNCLLGNGKKIAKFLMRTFTCRSTFLYGAHGAQINFGDLTPYVTYVCTYNIAEHLSCLPKVTGTWIL
jgi:hypothetical protein